jgi:hypothetical protein
MYPSKIQIWRLYGVIAMGRVVWSGCIALKIDEEHNHDTRVFASQ